MPRRVPAQLSLDCDGDGSISRADLDSAALVALGAPPAITCFSLSGWPNDAIAIDEVLRFLAGESATTETTSSLPVLQASVSPGADIASATGAPGQRLQFRVTLRSGGTDVAGMQNDIILEMSDVPVAANGIGRPDCTIGSAVDAPFGGFSFQPFGCSGTSCTGMRAVVGSFSLTPIPDGAVLYTCNVDVSSAAAPGDYPLQIGNLILSTPGGMRVAGVTGTDGVIHVHEGPPLIRGDHRDPRGRKVGCQVEWSVVNATNPLDRYGLLANQIVCEDASSPCDFQPEYPGRCQFRVQVCLNNSDPGLSDCRPDGISAVLVEPTRATHGNLAAVSRIVSEDSAALVDALNHLQDPVNPSAGFVYAPPLALSQVGLCSDVFPVNVVVGALRSSFVTLKVRSYDRNAPVPRREVSRLKLVCKPRPLP